MDAAKGPNMIEMTIIIDISYRGAVTVNCGTIPYIVYKFDR